MFVFAFDCVRRSPAQRVRRSAWVDALVEVFVVTPRDGDCLASRYPTLVLGRTIPAPAPFPLSNPFTTAFSTPPTSSSTSTETPNASNSARSPYPSKTGVLWVCQPVIVFGLPAWPTTSTACPTRTLTCTGFNSSSTVIKNRGCIAVTR